MEKQLKDKMTVGIVEILARNNFCHYSNGYGRKPRLRDLDENGVLLQGGFLGASFKVDTGLKVWNLSSKSRGNDVSVQDLLNIETELKELFQELVCQ